MVLFLILFTICASFNIKCFAQLSHVPCAFLYVWYIFVCIYLSVCVSVCLLIYIYLLCVYSCDGCVCVCSGVYVHVESSDEPWVFPLLLSSLLSETGSLAEPEAPCAVWTGYPESLWGLSASLFPVLGLQVCTQECFTRVFEIWMHASQTYYHELNPKTNVCFIYLTINWILIN